MPTLATSKQDALSATFAALSDPTRRAMLKRLSQGEATVNDLAAPFKMSLPAVSKHIKVLEKAGLLTKTIQKQQRPCKLNSTKLKQVVDWIEMTTNSIAPQEISTLSTGKNDQINSKTTATIETRPTKTKIVKNPKRKNNNSAHQQTGFDF